MNLPSSLTAYHQRRKFICDLTNENGLPCRGPFGCLRFLVTQSATLHPSVSAGAPCGSVIRREDGLSLFDSVFSRESGSFGFCEIRIGVSLRGLREFDAQTDRKSTRLH